MLVSLGTLATQQSKPTESLWNDITWFLNYAASHPHAKNYFSASDMILNISSDGSYLSESKSHSPVGGSIVQKPGNVISEGFSWF